MSLLEQLLSFEDTRSLLFLLISEVDITVLYFVSKEIQACIDTCFLIKKCKFCEKCAKEGYVETALWGRNMNCFYVPDRLVKHSAKYGQLEFLKNKDKLNMNIRISHLRDAELSGRTEIMDFIRDSCPSIRREVCAYGQNAAKKGYLHIIQWLVRNKKRLHPELNMYAIKYGQVKMLRWLIKTPTYNIDEFKSCLYAINYEQLECLKLCCESFDEISDIIFMQEAAVRGNVEIFKLLRNEDRERRGERCPWNHKTIKRALRYDRTELVKWMRNKDREIDCGGKCPMTVGNLKHAEHLKETDPEFVKWLVIEYYSDIW